VNGPPGGRAAATEAAAAEAARYRQLERRWQNDVGWALLDAPFATPGSAAVFERQWNRLVAAAAGAPDGVLLEVGCGKGHFLRWARPRAPRHTLVGLDLSRAVYSLAERELLGVQADGEALPFRDACAACVVYDGALHHLIDYRAALRDAIRVLRPGGRLIIFEPVSSAFSRLVHRLLDPLIFRKVVYESPIDLRYKRDFDAAAITAVLREQGMSWREERSDFLAYPLTGCYAGSAFGSRDRLLRWAMVWEDRIAARARLGGLARRFAWRFTIVADKPER
jgi:SAM-dependent methyltransferase